MKKLLILFLITGNSFAQKPLEFAIKYNFTPIIQSPKSNGMTMEFPISKIISVDLSHASGFNGSTNNPLNFLKYRTTLAELRFN